ncbi:hypothetical protein KM043_008549 [Ampulex compressa]|nr:hypothetical protein KM043_008549 [Ampulex compressa]
MRQRTEYYAVHRPSLPDPAGAPNERDDMASTIEILFGIALLVLALYYYFTSTFDHWKIRGVAGPTPIPVFGNSKDVFLAKEHLACFLKKVYDQYKKEPMFGVFILRTPLLVLIDPDLIKDILIRDFAKMPQRAMRIYTKTEPMSQHLFALESERWRPLRTRLTPVFTSGKLKTMFMLILECSKELDICLKQMTAEDRPIDCRKLAAKYTTDIISVCALGLDINSLSKEENVFRKIGKKIVPDPPRFLIWEKVKEMVPWFYDILGYVMPEKEISDFFIKTMRDTIEYRRENNIVINDFFNILMDLEEHPEKLSGIEVTNDLLAAQIFVFLVAGFETSSSALSNALYELALNPHVQERLRKEIDEVHERIGENLSNEDVKQMKYMDQVFRETLRKYPPMPELERRTTSSYTFENVNVTVPKNQIIKIPIYAIHRDPDIYPDPETFNPERFNEENTATRHPMHFLPFGNGPRNCIGARFANYQVKIGLVQILRNYKIEPCKETAFSYKGEPKDVARYCGYTEIKRGHGRSRNSGATAWPGVWKFQGSNTEENPYRCISETAIRRIQKRSRSRHLCVEDARVATKGSRYHQGCHDKRLLNLRRPRIDHSASGRTDAEQPSPYATGKLA